MSVLGAAACTVGVLAAVFTLALCRAAARGDQLLDQLDQDH